NASEWKRHFSLLDLTEIDGSRNPVYFFSCYLRSRYARSAKRACREREGSGSKDKKGSLRCVMGNVAPARAPGVRHRYCMQRAMPPPPPGASIQFWNPSGTERHVNDTSMTSTSAGAFIKSDSTQVLRRSAPRSTP